MDDHVILVVETVECGFDGMVLQQGRILAFTRPCKYSPAFLHTSTITIKC